MALAEKQRLAVWATPAPAAGGSASPSATRTSWASCRRRSARLSETLKGHDLVLVVGSSVFPYYPYIPGPLLRRGTALVQITSDPSEAARAPMGDAIVGDVGAGAARGCSSWSASASARRPSRAPEPGEPADGRPDQRLGGDGGAR